MYEMTSKPLVRRTLATLRRAELGFLGVVVYAGAHATTLRAVLHRRRFGFRGFDLTAVTHELVNGWHFWFPLKNT